MYTLILMATLFADSWHGGNVERAPVQVSGYTLAECEAEAKRWRGTIEHVRVYATNEPVYEVRAAECVRQPGPTAPVATANEMPGGVAWETR